jgi:hypothetical protein
MVPLDEPGDGEVLPEGDDERRRLVVRKSRLEGWWQQPRPATGLEWKGPNPKSTSRLRRVAMAINAVTVLSTYKCMFSRAGEQDPNTKLLIWPAGDLQPQKQSIRLDVTSRLAVLLQCAPAPSRTGHNHHLAMLERRSLVDHESRRACTHFLICTEQGQGLASQSVARAPLFPSSSSARCRARASQGDHACHERARVPHGWILECPLPIITSHASCA